MEKERPYRTLVWTTARAVRYLVCYVRCDNPKLGDNRVGPEAVNRRCSQKVLRNFAYDTSPSFPRPILIVPAYLPASRLPTSQFSPIIPPTHPSAKFIHLLPASHI
ncbi:unnamed protein product, partial [Tuber aestivum]